MATKIRIFNPPESLDQFIRPHPKLEEIIRQHYGKFFIVPVQDLIKVSKLPFPPIRAYNHTLIYLTSGTATMKVGFQTVQIRKGECLVVPAGQVVSYDRYEAYNGFLCNLNPDFLVGKIGSSDLLQEFEFLAIWGNPLIRPSRQTRVYLIQLFQRLLNEYEESGLANKNLLQAYLIAALCELNGAYQPLSVGTSKTAGTLTNRFKQLLHEHIRTLHLVGEYARLLNVSPNHLNKTVGAVTGKTPSKWIDETLMTEAKILLLQTSNPIAQIANELGMEDSSYFARMFKRYEGVTPQAYRKRIETS